MNRDERKARATRVGVPWTLIISLALGGCALGATQLGQQWHREGSTEQERDAAIASCKVAMQARPRVDSDEGCPPILVPGHTACIIGNDVSARKAYSRNCMQASGWELK